MKEIATRSASARNDGEVFLASLRSRGLSTFIELFANGLS